MCHVFTEPVASVSCSGSCAVLLICVGNKISDDVALLYLLLMSSISSTGETRGHKLDGCPRGSQELQITQYKERCPFYRVPDHGSLLCIGSQHQSRI